MRVGAWLLMRATNKRKDNRGMTNAKYSLTADRPPMELVTIAIALSRNESEPPSSRSPSDHGVKEHRWC
jgi:hypothetical protein